MYLKWIEYGLKFVIADALNSRCNKPKNYTTKEPKNYPRTTTAVAANEDFFVYCEQVFIWIFIWSNWYLWMNFGLKTTLENRGWLTDWQRAPEMGLMGSLCTVFERHRIDFRWKFIVSALLYTRRQSVHSTVFEANCVSWVFLLVGGLCDLSQASFSLGCE